MSAKQGRDLCVRSFENVAKPGGHTNDELNSVRQNHTRRVERPTCVVGTGPARPEEEVQ